MVLISDFSIHFDIRQMLFDYIYYVKQIFGLICKEGHLFKDLQCIDTVIFDNDISTCLLSELNL